MQITIANRDLIKIIVLDAVLIAAIIVMPVISHILPVPLYLIEPMRLMVLGSLLLRNKKNSLFLALTLPIVSFFFTGHPVFVKVIIISFELILNVFFFEFLIQRFNTFVSVFISVMISKTIYYVVKYFFVSSGVLRGDVISTPLSIQMFTTVAMSIVLYFLLSHRIND